MSIRTSSFLVLGAIVSLGACNNDVELATMSLRGLTMGTTYSITLVSPPVSLPLQELTLEIEKELEHIEALASTYRPDSELSALNQLTSMDWIPVSAELCDILARAMRVSVQTGGAFDPTIGPIVNLWGFGAADRGPGIPSQPEIDNAMQSVGFAKLRLDCDQSIVRKFVPGMQLDLSAWAKGHAVDRIAELLERMGANNFLVEIGGELRAKGHNSRKSAFVIGIENPVAGEATVTTSLLITDAAIATSGDYRNFFMHAGERYSHTIDPRTGWPIHHELASVTVISKTAANADALATAMLVLGPDAGLAMANDREIPALFIRMTQTGPQVTRSNALQSRDKRGLALR